jgi:hypothetical protein
MMNKAYFCSRTEVLTWMGGLLTQVPGSIE